MTTKRQTRYLRLETDAELLKRCIAAGKTPMWGVTGELLDAHADAHRLTRRIVEDGDA